MVRILRSFGAALAVGVTACLACGTFGGRTGLDATCSSGSPGGDCAPNGAGGGAGAGGAGGSVIGESGFGGVVVGPPASGAAGSFGDFPGGGFAGVPSGGFGNFGNPTSGGFPSAPDSGVAQGGTSSGGFAGSPTGGFGNFGSGGSGSLPPGVCFDLPVTPLNPNLSLFFLIDRSIAMGCPISGTEDTSFRAVTNAIDQFVSDPANSHVSVGIEFFGRAASDGGAGTSCNVLDYETPDTDVSYLFQDLGAIEQTIDAEAPSGDAPLLAALKGASLHAVALQKYDLNPFAIVVITGTEPKSCSPATDLEQAAESAALGSVSTYVIAVPTPASGCDRSTVVSSSPDLDELARGGSMDQKAFVANSNDLEPSILGRIRAIQSTLQPAVPCVYAVPYFPSAMADTDHASFVYDDASGNRITLPELQPGFCGSDGVGFVYEGSFQADLCSATCATVREVGSSLAVQFPCLAASTP